MWPISLIFSIILTFGGSVHQGHGAPLIGEMTARNFMDHLSAGSVDRAVLLMADEVNFDGDTVRGRDLVARRLDAMLRRVGGYVDWKYVYVLSGDEARRRFGPLPARLSSVKLEGAVVALGRRPGGGLAVILRDTGDGVWRVVGMTD